MALILSHQSFWHPLLVNQPFQTSSTSLGIALIRHSIDLINATLSELILGNGVLRSRSFAGLGQVGCRFQYFWCNEFLPLWNSYDSFFSSHWHWQQTSKRCRGWSRKLRFKARKMGFLLRQFQVAFSSNWDAEAHKWFGLAKVLNDSIVPGNPYTEDLYSTMWDPPVLPLFVLVAPAV